nr:hypothetical protein [Rhodopirellula baltica]
MKQYGVSKLRAIVGSVQRQNRDKTRREIEPQTPCIDKAQSAGIDVAFQIVRSDKPTPINELILASRFLAFVHAAIVIDHDRFANRNSAVDK